MRTSIILVVGTAIGVAGLGSVTTIVAQAKAKPFSTLGVNSTSYELKAVTTIKTGLREYPETVYTYTQSFNGGNRQERWRITLNDRYTCHWVGPDGLVWVLTSSMAGPGGGGRLWVRDPMGNQVAAWSNAIIYDGKGAQAPFNAKPAGDIDMANSGVHSLGNSGSQLVVRLKSGSETRLTLATTESNPYVPVVRRLPAGDKKEDKLSALLTECYGPPMLTLPLAERAPIAIWRANTPRGPIFLQETYLPEPRPNAFTPQTVVSEREVPAMPTYVGRTPSGHFLSVIFALGGQAQATMEVISAEGKLLSSIDLIKLGKFRSTDEAKRMLLYREISPVSGRDAGLPIDDTESFSYGQAEELSMKDRSGREYRIKIGTGPDATVVASASLNLEAVPAREPSYPNATKLSETSVTSPDHRFTIRTRSFMVGKTPTSTMTLIAHIKDPVKGMKDTEVWSTNLPAPPLQVTVSNSGRAFGFMVFDTHATQPNVPKQLALLGIWDADGHGINMDVMQQKWFPSIEAAKTGLNLQKLTTSLEGAEGQLEVEGVPVPVWPVEHVVVPLPGGEQAFQIRSGTVPGQMSMIYLRR